MKYVNRHADGRAQIEDLREQHTGEYLDLKGRMQEGDGENCRMMWKTKDKVLPVSEFTPHHEDYDRLKDDSTLTAARYGREGALAVFVLSNKYY